ncbi:hypothetical protein PAXRUDRAFT_800254 [Paxillus rubicundulus Ve08.2h10]|uniref:Uncharacterized protein n=1 Tax=Paxillus rubicundulus Ve08.2h10 TaxID=930991 RepID=A0A0D0BK48_9AGAM|nr:hypothetical protein PAXRUDRAFT_800254 [Paxillus rubicundulus Ve08.2h10]
MSATSVAQTVYPTIEYIDTETALLQPLVITINFSGPVPRHLIPTPNNFPIKVSISLLEDYCKILAPPVHEKACSTYEPGHADQFIDVGVWPNTQHPITNLPIPLSPLPQMFDPTNTRHWAVLTKEIKHWPVNKVCAPHPQWTWGHEAFWLTFIGANPMFPGGRWFPWDFQIPLEGPFIEEWLSDDMIGTADNGHDIMPDGLFVKHTLSFVWDMFHVHVALFYPFPLTLTSQP